MSVADGLAAHTHKHVDMEVVEDIRLALARLLNGVWRDHPIRGFRVSYFRHGTLGHLPFGRHRLRIGAALGLDCLLGFGHLCLRMFSPTSPGVKNGIDVEVTLKTRPPQITSFYPARRLRCSAEGRACTVPAR
jgi:hypothetical protein